MPSECGYTSLDDAKAPYALDGKSIEAISRDMYVIVIACTDSALVDAFTHAYGPVPDASAVESCSVEGEAAANAHGAHLAAMHRSTWRGMGGEQNVPSGTTDPSAYTGLPHSSAAQQRLTVSDRAADSQPERLLQLLACQDDSKPMSSNPTASDRSARFGRLTVNPDRPAGALGIRKYFRAASS